MILALNNKLTAKKTQLFSKEHGKRKASLLLDIVLGIVLMMIIYYIATVAYPEYRNNANRAQAKEDLSTLKTAVISYQGMQKEPSSINSIDVLLEGLDADESIDGTDHKAVLTENKLDPWGGEYEIDIDSDGSGTISTSNAVSVGGLSDEITITLGSADD